MIYEKAGKRTLDVALSALMLVLTAPLQAALAVTIRKTEGPPALFRQERAGRHGAPFILYKFRTMRPGDERPAERVTPLGRVLRNSSLDELPQLWNVLTGDMSLVGPRPLHMRYNARYNARQRRRLAVRPGLTGLAQTQGRNALTWDEKFDWDVRYVEAMTLRQDLRILWSTLRLVARGLSRRTSAATMPGVEFVGGSNDGSTS
jgi:lipopolysaccharide/colanic/teichoic acid biosynthesis glycosyltransferase